MKTKEDLQTYIDATMDRTLTGTDSNQAYDTRTIVDSDDNINDAIRTGKSNDLVKAGEGNDYVRTGRGDDNIGGQEGHDVIKLGKGDNRAFGGEGNDMIMGQRGNDFMDGGEGNDIFGAVNGSNLVRTGEGNDKIVVTFKQEKMEGRKGNEAGHADEDAQDHYTTITDFEIGADKIHMTGLKERKAFTKLEFDVSKDGTMILDQDGNKIVFLRDVHVEDPAKFIAESMDFGKFDWKGKQLETLMTGDDAPGGVKSDGSFKGVDFKDRHSDYAEFDFGALGKEDEFKFFHGSDGHQNAEAKAAISGSSISETEMPEFMALLAEGVQGMTVRNVTEDSFTLDVYSGAYDGVTDTLVFSGAIVEENIDLIA
ncbi:MAG: hypothetical protein AAF665_01590 [Pseudomonadota bacterium]